MSSLMPITVYLLCVPSRPFPQMVDMWDAYFVYLNEKACMLYVNVYVYVCAMFGSVSDGRLHKCQFLLLVFFYVFNYYILCVYLLMRHTTQQWPISSQLYARIMYSMYNDSQENPNRYSASHLNVKWNAISCHIRCEL